jgi:hypothetical protein
MQMTGITANSNTENSRSFFACLRATTKPISFVN